MTYGELIKCSVDGCEKPHKGRGLCGSHYTQLWRSGLKLACSVDGCNKPAKVVERELCSMHYARWLRHGDVDALRPNPPRVMPAADRFWAKVDQSGECWVWTGAVSRTGYGAFYWDGRIGRAHRFSYELLVGPIPDGLDLDHLCRVRNCVRPDHLEPVTRQVNVQRGHRWKRTG